MKTKPIMSFDQYAQAQIRAGIAALRELSCVPCDKVPPGWLTIDEWLGHYARSGGRTIKAAQMRSILRRGLAAGKFERSKFRVRAGSLVRKIDHFKVKK